MSVENLKSFDDMIFLLFGICYDEVRKCVKDGIGLEILGSSK